MEIKAILFDFDGVLANTMNDLFSAWKKAFLEFGIQIEEGDYFQLEGMKVLEVAKVISNKYGLKTDFDEIVRLKNDFYLKENSFSFYPGVVGLVEKLNKKGIKIAIVSASPREKIEKTVPKFFQEYFNCIITAEDYNLGKPNPEPYLKAINKLNLIPEECIVVENAPLGIKAAKEAGCFCIAISSTLPKDFLGESDLIIDKFEELNNLSILKELLK